MIDIDVDLEMMIRRATKSGNRARCLGIGTF